MGLKISGISSLLESQSIWHQERDLIAWDALSSLYSSASFGALER